jgi:hypothetical protein
MGISFAQQAQAKQIITNPDRADGFGAQFQTIIYSAICAELNNMDYAYTPFNKIEHNYDNDPYFILEKEWLINFIGNFELNRTNATKLDVGNVVNFCECSQNLAKSANSSVLKKIKKVFKANKDRSKYFDAEHFHIVIHLRRPNQHDNRVYGTDVSEDLYLATINKLRQVYADKNPLFHLHSQGSAENFTKFNAPDIMLHLNESVEDSFIPMVLADVLVTGRSSFSYTAGLISEGTVYYTSFWCPPLPGWKLVTDLLKQ